MCRRPLLELPQVKAPYVVLRSEGRDNQQAVHVVSLADGKVLHLGRGQGNAVRIEDVTLSRSHAAIRFEDGAFLLEDSRSKYGTLLAVCQDQTERVVPGKPLSLQVGCTLLSLTLPESPAN